MPPKQPRPMSLRKTQQSGEGAIAGGAGRGLPAGWTTAKDPTSGHSILLQRDDRENAVGVPDAAKGHERDCVVV